MFIETTKKLLKEKGVTVNKMLNALNMGSGTFATWEKRGTIPSGEALSKIADYLDVSVDYLLGKTAAKEKPAVNGDDELTEYLEELKNRSEMRMLFKLAKGATKKDVEDAVKIIEALRGREHEDE